MTLIELVVVLMILVALAGLVTARSNNFFAAEEGGQSALDVWRDTTLLSFTAARKAVLGDPSRPYSNGFLADVGRIPTKMSELFTKPAGVPEFTPSIGRGWRGPYFVSAMGAYRVSDPQGFTAVYGEDGDLTLLDSWGLPIVLQIPDPNEDGVISDLDEQYARFVSAGPNGRVETPRTSPMPQPREYAYFPPRSHCGDDLLLYLRIADLRPD